jgi:hypothetical protein
LRKGAYYLARIVYLRQQPRIDDLVAEAAPRERKAQVAREFLESIDAIVSTSFDEARRLFQQGLNAYLAEEGGNEDAALKNTEFARKLDALARPPQPNAHGAENP